MTHNPNHKEWIATGLHFTTNPGGETTTTWDTMVCADCGAVRSENILRPGESVSFNVGELGGMTITDVNWLGS